MKKAKFKDLDSALADADVEAGLECRISLSNFKLFFVEGTEDFMRRVGKPKPKGGKGKKAEKPKKKRKLEDIIQQKFGSKISNPS